MLSLPAAGARGRARAGRAWPAGHRHARVLRREPRDLCRRPAARAADRVLLGAAAVGQVPARRAWRRYRRRSSTGCCKIPIVRRPGAQEDPHGARPGPGLHLRRGRRGADAARAAALVPPARAGHRRGLRHDRESRGLSHATVPGQATTGTVGPTYDGVQCRIDPDTGEIQIKSPATDARLLQGARADPAAPSPTTAGCTPATRARSTPRAT